MSEPKETGPALSPQTVIVVAKAQKVAMWGLLVMTAGFASAMILENPRIGLFVWIAAILASMHSVHRLSASLKTGSPLLYCIGLFVPVMGLLVLFTLSCKATDALEARILDGAPGEDAPA